MRQLQQDAQENTSTALKKRTSDIDAAWRYADWVALSGKSDETLAAEALAVLEAARASDQAAEPQRPSRSSSQTQPSAV